MEELKSISAASAAVLIASLGTCAAAAYAWITKITDKAVTQIKQDCLDDVTDLKRQIKDLAGRIAALEESQREARLHLLSAAIKAAEIGAVEVVGHVQSASNLLH